MGRSCLPLDWVYSCRVSRDSFSPKVRPDPLEDMMHHWRFIPLKSSTIPWWLWLWDVSDWVSTSYLSWCWVTNIMDMARNMIMYQKNQRKIATGNITRGQSNLCCFILHVMQWTTWRSYLHPHSSGNFLTVNDQRNQTAHDMSTRRIMQTQPALSSLQRLSWFLVSDWFTTPARRWWALQEPIELAGLIIRAHRASPHVKSQWEWFMISNLHPLPPQ